MTPILTETDDVEDLPSPILRACNTVNMLQLRTADLLSKGAELVRLDGIGSDDRPNFDPAFVGVAGGLLEYSEHSVAVLFPRLDRPGTVAFLLHEPVEYAVQDFRVLLGKMFL